MAKKGKKISRQKIATIGINYDIIPDQVTETINIDEDNINIWKAKIKQDYADIATAAGEVSSYINRCIDSNLFKGKSLSNLNDITKYANNQKKYIEGRSTALDKQIRSDIDEMNDVVDSSKYTNDIVSILNSDKSTVAEKANATAMLGVVNMALKSTGYTLNADGTYTNGDQKLKISADGKTLERVNEYTAGADGTFTDANGNQYKVSADGKTLTAVDGKTESTSTTGENETKVEASDTGVPAAKEPESDKKHTGDEYKDIAI